MAGFWLVDGSLADCTGRQIFLSLHFLVNRRTPQLTDIGTTILCYLEIKGRHELKARTRPSSRAGPDRQNEGKLSNGPRQVGKMKASFQTRWGGPAE